MGLWQRIKTKDMPDEATGTAPPPSPSQGAVTVGEVTDNTPSSSLETILINAPFLLLNGWYYCELYICSGGGLVGKGDETHNTQNNK